MGIYEYDDGMKDGTMEHTTGRRNYTTTQSVQKNVKRKQNNTDDLRAHRHCLRLVSSVRFAPSWPSVPR
jgi:hypothetical protein